MLEPFTPNLLKGNIWGSEKPGENDGNDLKEAESSPFSFFLHVDFFRYYDEINDLFRHPNRVQSRRNFEIPVNTD